MKISTDEVILFQKGFITINNTLLFSWIVMFILIFLAFILKLKINKQQKRCNKILPSSIQNFFEILIECIEGQVKQVSTKKIEIVFPFISTLFIFIVTSNLISLVPMFESPTGSLSTTVALSLSTFIFSIWFGVKDKGFFNYFKKYFKPIPLLLPLNIIGDLSKIISLSFRLYGNIMSSGAIVVILSQIAFLSVGFPIVINLLGTISGVIQAYIFSILSMITISSDN